MNKLEFTQLVQEKSNWCWVATGLSIAQYLGHAQDTTQEAFFLTARDLPEGSPCPDESGDLPLVQHGWEQLSLRPGTFTRDIDIDSSNGETNSGTRVFGTLTFDIIKEEIDANRPILTRVSHARGDHARVIYGYDADGDTVWFSDPASDSERYQSTPYASYVENAECRWLRSVHRIGLDPQLA